MAINGIPVGIYSLDTYQPASAAGSLLGRVRAQMLVALDTELARDEVLGPLEVTAAQLIVLVKLADSDRPIAISELCKGISYEAGAMTRMLDRLEAKGLVRRSRSEQDRRVVLLALTEAGRTAYPRVREMSLRINNRALGDFAPAEAAQLESFLLRMSHNLKTHSQEAQP